MTADAMGAAQTAGAEVVDADAVLIQRARHGDARAFERLYGLHSGRVFGLCLRMTGNHASAEDCLQETFVKAWTRLEKFRGEARFSTWLHRIAVNEVLDHQRRESRRGIETDIDDMAFAEPAVPHDSEDPALEKAIAGLPDGARNALVLQALYGYTHEEAGAMLGIAAGTCKAQLHRARKLLAETLDR